MVTKYNNFDWEKRSTESATNYGACRMPTVVVWVNTLIGRRTLIFDLHCLVKIADEFFLVEG